MQPSHRLTPFPAPVGLFYALDGTSAKLILVLSVLFRDEVGEKSQFTNGGKNIMKTKDGFDSSAS
jgi:hypothetical protein